MVTALKQTWTAPSIYLPTYGVVRSVRPMTGMEKLFDIALPEGMSLGHKPGQFVEVSLFGVGEAPIRIRGPFGTGFPIERFRGKDMLFAPGGLGLAPLRSLINQVLDERSDFGRVSILYGARRPAEPRLPAGPPG